MAVYVVGDLHGCFDEWMQMKNYIENKDKDAQFIFVGDIIDRGQKQIELLDWAIENITDNGKYQMIIGNHESMKIDRYRDAYRSIEMDFDEDERPKLTDIIDIDYICDDNYSFIEVLSKHKKTYEYLNKIIAWFSKLDYYKDITVDNKRFIVAHANIPYSIVNDDNTLKPNNSLNESEKEFIVWDRGTEDFDKVPNATLIHGHSPSIFAECFPWEIELTDDMLGKTIHMKNRINIDCGITYKQYGGIGDYGDLCIIRLNDLKEFYLSNIKEVEANE